MPRQTNTSDSFVYVSLDPGYRCTAYAECSASLQLSSVVTLHLTGPGLPCLFNLDLLLGGCRLSHLGVSNALHLASIAILFIVFTPKISQGSTLQTPIRSRQLGVYVLHLCW